MKNIIFSDKNIFRRKFYFSISEFNRNSNWPTKVFYITYTQSIKNYDMIDCAMCIVHSNYSDHYQVRDGMKEQCKYWLETNSPQNWLCSVDIKSCSSKRTLSKTAVQFSSEAIEWNCAVKTFFFHHIIPNFKWIY